MGLLKKLGIHNKEDFKRFVVQVLKFGIIGAFNTILNTAIFQIVIAFDEELWWLGHTLGFAITVASAYFLNRKFVFKHESGHLKAVVKTYISYGITFALGMGLIPVLVNFFSIPVWLSQPMTLIITVPMNFLLTRFWAFREERKTEEDFEKIDEAIERIGSEE